MSDPLLYGKAVEGTGATLLPCPKCGAPAVRIEYDYYIDGEKNFGWGDHAHRHEGTVRCSRDTRCYYPHAPLPFPDDYYYNFYSGTRCKTGKELWDCAEKDWNAAAANYALKRQPDPRRCSCGYKVRKGFSFCPMCGKPAPEACRYEGKELADD